MGKYDKDPFGGAFDFNGDGRTDVGEEWIAYQTANDRTFDDLTIGRPSASATGVQRNGEESFRMSSGQMLMSALVLLATTAFMYVVSLWSGRLSDSGSYTAGLTVMFAAVALGVVILWKVLTFAKYGKLRRPKDKKK